jgi:hypothetical protein
MSANLEKLRRKERVEYTLKDAISEEAEGRKSAAVDQDRLEKKSNWDSLI